MKRSIPLLMILMLWTTVTLRAQVQLDHPILLEGSEGQLNGLLESTLPHAVLTAGVEGSGTHRFAIATAGPLWNVDLPSLTTAPVEGLHLLVRSDASSAGPLSISVNGSGPYPITRGPSDPVLAEEIPPGSVLSLVFDGSVFQVMNGTAHSRRDCPAGTTGVSDQYCIEQTERDTADFFEASLICAQQGYRLCSWGEFIVACQNGAVLGLQQMTGNYEWTNSAANEDNCVRVAGNANCQQAGATFATVGTYHFRCCLSR
ncbi:MAG: hypothetical protein ABI432_12530 [Flavobacteriales bacterium]